MNAVLAIIADGGRVIVVNLQADRGCAAVAFFWGGEGAFDQKRVLRSAGYGFLRRKKSSASRQYCKCINRQ
jgi:hypothetical protein